MSTSVRQIGRYRILEELGSGGMSVVYKGLDTTLEREVAVKVLHPHLSNKQESRKRLAREAKAVAKLHHPNILEVFDFSAEEAEDAYLVTELIRGQTLRAYLETERLDPPELAVMVTHQIASALAHAHAEGVIHRDLKPENVMVREDGVLKLMDFGIAKLLDRDDRMTQTGALVGSPAHMAPEVIEGEAATCASDVFSLGTMLYLFTTGKLPFVGPNTTATLKRILDGAYEDPRAHAPAVSDELAALIATAMARDPEARYPDAHAFREALEDHLRSVGLERVEEELSAFFADPSGHRLRLTARLVDRLITRAEALVAEGRNAKALAVLNQLLALDRDHPRARPLLERMDRARRRRKRLRKAGGATLGIVLVALCGWGMSRAIGRDEGSAGISPAHAPVHPEQRPEGAASKGPAPVSPTRAESVHPEHLHTSVTAAHPEPVHPQRRPVPPPATTKAHHAVVLARASEPEKTVAKVPVRILVRPYGFIQVDGGPRSAQALARHTLQLLPGKHEVAVLCDYCRTSTEAITVTKDGQNVFRIPAELKPAQLRFRVQPPDTEVTIGGIEKSAGESLLHPFVIRSPKGPPSFQHVVTYSLSHPGDRPVRKTIRIPAGQSEVIQAKLSPR